MLWGLALLTVIELSAPPEQAAPAAVLLVPSFDEAQFAEPEATLWPGYFWLWNAPLDENVIRAQLADMASHGARSVAMLPMPHAFRPDSTNNSMDPDYLTPEFFERVRFAVDEAAKLGMKWWLYDEGGWPSGQAVGKVVEGHPELKGQRLVWEPVESAEPFVVPQDAVALVVEDAQHTRVMPGQTWTPTPEVKTAKLYRVAQQGGPDLLNPAAIERFITLTHQGYKDAVGSHFGNTILFTFTDEPGVPNLDPPKSIPWTPEFSTRPELLAQLPSLFVPPSPDMPQADAQARIAFYDLWSARFRDAYFGQIETWCRQNGIGSGGHLNGEDETINAVRYGFGQALRQLRAMDVPGVDVIWRQLFPGQPNQSDFPRLASSAAHQNGTRYAFTESFCVYGSGITPAQMKWLVDYQYVRGINLFVGGCYSFGMRDHQMTGERPHFGPTNPLWDHLPGFHAYTARLGYALSAGKPKASIALYYPARDMWAWGLNTTAAVESHDALARELVAHPCDFDLIDDDLMAAARIEDGRFVAGAVRYDTIVCGDVRWMHSDSFANIKAFAEAGGRVVCVGHAPGIDGNSGQDVAQFVVADTPAKAVATLKPAVDLFPHQPGIRDVVLENGVIRTDEFCPRPRGLRVTVRTVADGDIVFLFNEGTEAYEGELGVTQRHAYELLPLSGAVRKVPKREDRIRADLEPGESLLLLLTDAERETPRSDALTADFMKLEGTMTAKPRRAFVVGEHEFEIKELNQEAVPFEQAARWAGWLGEDFSGEVDYCVTFEVPEAWANCPLQLETGPVEYAATVLLDGANAGYLLWSPWCVELPPCAPGKHELTIRVANTLANELTSQRVADEWAQKKGPGWPSPYHVRALEFERESRGGGLSGPIVLRRMETR